MSSKRMLVIPLAEYEELIRKIEGYEKALTDLSDGKNVFKTTHYGYNYSTTVYSSNQDLTGSIDLLDKLRTVRLPVFNFRKRSVNDVINDLRTK